MADLKVGVLSVIVPKTVPRAEKSRSVSHVVTHDTALPVCWSPQGSPVASSFPDG